MCVCLSERRKGAREKLDDGETPLEKEMATSEKLRRAFPLFFSLALSRRIESQQEDQHWKAFLFLFADDRIEMSMKKTISRSSAGIRDENLFGFDLSICLNVTMTRWSPSSFSSLLSSSSSFLPCDASFSS